MCVRFGLDDWRGEREMLTIACMARENSIEQIIYTKCGKSLQPRKLNKQTHALAHVETLYH